MPPIPSEHCLEVLVGKLQDSVVKRAGLQKDGLHAQRLGLLQRLERDRRWGNDRHARVFLGSRQLREGGDGRVGHAVDFDGFGAGVDGGYREVAGGVPFEYYRHSRVSWVSLGVRFWVGRRGVGV